VSDPASSAAAANGQYILISREAYDAVGGHEGVAASLLEDVALARAVKASGRKIFFRYGKDAVRTRMYRSFAQLEEGWTKNLALLFPSPGRLALLRLTEFVLIGSSVTVATLMGMKGRTPASAAVGILAFTLIGFFLRRIRKAHFSWDVTVLALIGLPLFAYLLLRSRNAYQKGSVPWKGRRYTGNGMCASVVADQVKAGRPLGNQHDAGATPSHATSI
jgi:hypothetical protein